MVYMILTQINLRPFTLEQIIAILILVFRTFIKEYHHRTLGTYNLANSKIDIWHNEDNDSTIYTFCYNELNNKVYTIEHSLKEFSTTHYPHIPKHKIIQYTENGIRKKEIYSTNKNINDISVNNDATKILFTAANVENSEFINKFYLLDVNSLQKEVILNTKDKFTRIKLPKFSLDEKGFYFLGSTPDSKIIEEVEGTLPITENAIYYYEFKTKNTYKVFEIPNNVINIYKLN
ncbi:hypothetical protein SAMN02745163_00442 [Clostridium cavendishii DSM 21758]|uniref:DUF5050 domain-containing protein n=2 Tax=Clostridium TaxID=1485 RepID=A0A1M6CEH6_9CLOT|nr:hypothetical protein SAMN02745163_00442 [Clostridium cavendishii DSM 21758]